MSGLSAKRKPLVALPSRQALERKLEALIRDAREVRLVLQLAKEIESEDSKTIDLEQIESELRQQK